MRRAVSKESCRYLGYEYTNAGLTFSWRVVDSPWLRLCDWFLRVSGDKRRLEGHECLCFQNKAGSGPAASPQSRVGFGVIPTSNWGFFEAGRRVSYANDELRVLGCWWVLSGSGDGRLCVIDVDDRLILYKSPGDAAIGFRRSTLERGIGSINTVGGSAPAYTDHVKHSIRRVQAIQSRVL